MATPWIKIEHTTPDKPEIDAISESLGIDPDHALGILVRLWIWADQQTVKGNAVSVTKKAIDRRARIEGFSDAMIESGWLACDSSGLTFVNFGRHNGQTAKQRAVTAKRVSKHKVKSNGDGNGDGNGDSVSESLKERYLELELELDSKKKNTKKKKASIPENYSDTFEEFWSAYPRREGKGHAWAAWLKNLKRAAASSKRAEDETVEQFLARRANDYAAFTSTKDREFIRLPATWLNGGNWDDETGSRVARPEEMKNWRPE